MSKPKAAASVSPDACKPASPCNGHRARLRLLPPASALGLLMRLGGWLGTGLLWILSLDHRLARTENRVVAVRLGYQLRSQIDLGFKVGNRFTPVHQRCHARQGSRRDGLEVVDLDLNGCTYLAFSQGRVQGGLKRFLRVPDRHGSPLFFESREQNESKRGGRGQISGTPRTPWHTQNRPEPRAARGRYLSTPKSNRRSEPKTSTAYSPAGSGDFGFRLNIFNLKVCPPCANEHPVWVCRISTGIRL